MLFIILILRDYTPLHVLMGENNDTTKNVKHSITNKRILFKDRNDSILVEKLKKIISSNSLSNNDKQFINETFNSFKKGNVSHSVMLASGLLHFIKKEDFIKLQAEKSKREREAKLMTKYNEYRKLIELKEYEYQMPRNTNLIDNRFISFDGSMEHQIDCLKFGMKKLLDSKSFIISHQMGLGKTLTTLMIMHNFRISWPKIKKRNQKKTNPTFLILAPKSNINHFTLEYRKYFREPNLFTNFLVINSTNDDLLDSDQLFNGTVCNTIVMTADICYNLMNRQEFNDSGLFSKPDLIIIDEAHIIKNEESLKYESFKRFICPKILITATPLQNDLDEINALASFVDPEHVEISDPLEHNLSNILHRKVNKNELEKLEELKVISQIKYDISENERNIYNIILNEKIGFFEKYHFIRTCLNYFTYFNESTFSLSSDDGFTGSSPNLISKIRKEISKSPHQVNTRLYHLIEIVKDIVVKKHDKLVIFISQVSSLQFLKDHIYSETKCQIVSLVGSNSNIEREQALKSFSNPEGANIILVSKRAGGYGIDLTVAHNLILFDSDYNYSIDEQSIYRLVRKNQIKKVNIYKFTANKTIDEKIEIIQNKKLKLTRDLFGEHIFK